MLIAHAIFFAQGYSLYFFLICGGLGEGFGSWLRILGLEFSVDGVCGLWCGAFWVFWLGQNQYFNLLENSL